MMVRAAESRAVLWRLRPRRKHVVLGVQSGADPYTGVALAARLGCDPGDGLRDTGKYLESQLRAGGWFQLVYMR